MGCRASTPFQTVAIPPCPTGSQHNTQPNTTHNPQPTVSLERWLHDACQLQYSGAVDDNEEPRGGHRNNHSRCAASPDRWARVLAHMLRFSRRDWLHNGDYFYDFVFHVLETYPRPPPHLALTILHVLRAAPYKPEELVRRVIPHFPALWAALRRTRCRPTRRARLAFCLEVGHALFVQDCDGVFDDDLAACRLDGV